MVTSHITAKLKQHSVAGFKNIQTHLWQSWVEIKHCSVTNHITPLNEIAELLLTVGLIICCIYMSAPYSVYMSLTFNTWGSRGFEQTPLLASKWFYTYCFKLYILSALLFEGGPCTSLANHRRPNGLVAAIELCKFVHDGPAWNAHLSCLGHCDERNHLHKCVNKRRLRVHQLSI